MGSETSDGRRLTDNADLGYVHAEVQTEAAFRAWVEDQARSTVWKDISRVFRGDRRRDELQRALRPLIDLSTEIGQNEILHHEALFALADYYRQAAIAVIRAAARAAEPPPVTGSRRWDPRTQPDSVEDRRTLVVALTGDEIDCLTEVFEAAPSGDLRRKAALRLAERYLNVAGDGLDDPEFSSRYSFAGYEGALKARDLLAIFNSDSRAATLWTAATVMLTREWLALTDQQVQRLGRLMTSQQIYLLANRVYEQLGLAEGRKWAQRENGSGDTGLGGESPVNYLIAWARDNSGLNLETQMGWQGFATCVSAVQAALETALESPKSGGLSTL